MATVKGTYSQVQNISQTIRFNEPTTVAAVEDMPATAGYFAAVIVTNMQAVDNLGGVRDIQKCKEVGEAREEIFTPAELADIVHGDGNGAGEILLSELTAAYTQAIGSV